jgi:hypothetical protein
VRTGGAFSFMNVLVMLALEYTPFAVSVLLCLS